MSVIRFSISLEEELAKELDEFVKNNQFSNRSQAIRHLIEKNLVEKKWMCGNIVAGAIILLYNYEKKDVLSSINDICHENREKVLSAQQFFLADESMISVIAVKGCSKELTLFSEQLIGIKGIKHGKLLMSRID